MEEQVRLRVEPWMRGLLLIAGAYNIGWGFFIYNFPDSFFGWVSQSEQAAPALIEWQGIGVLVFGIVYIFIAIYPVKLWYLLALGIASKVVGAIGFFWIVLDGVFVRQYLFHLIMNDLAWLIPFALILVRIVHVKKNTYTRAT